MKRLKELRKLNHMTMEELAKKVGVNKSTISLYENDKINPSIEILKSLANIFNVSVNYFLEDDTMSILPPKENTVKVISRGGQVEEVEFTDEEIEAFKTLFKNKFNKK